MSPRNRNIERITMERGDEVNDVKMEGKRERFNEKYGKLRRYSENNVQIDVHFFGGLSQPFSLIMCAISIMYLPSLYFWLDSNACSCNTQNELNILLNTTNILLLNILYTI